MKYVFIAIVYSNLVFSEYLHMEGGHGHNINWTKFSKDPKLNLKFLFQQLALSKTGRELIKMANKKAKTKGLSLYDVVGKGSGSLTDTTLIRRFDQFDMSKISYETRSKVFINKDLSQYDAILDLAHELTHFVYRKQFNPYVKNFSLSEFIKSTIEGQGGEVQAFLMECKVEKELFRGHKSGDRFNCDKIKDPISGELSFELASKRFYQVGSYYDSFTKILNKYELSAEFPDLSSSKESFVSSAYGIPYPVAAFEEYLTVLNKACENDKRRIGIFKKSKSRAPAALAPLESSYNHRCKGLFN